jgi:hypothetical protein
LNLHNRNLGSLFQIENYPDFIEMGRYPNLFDCTILRLTSSMYRVSAWDSLCIDPDTRRIREGEGRELSLFGKGHHNPFPVSKDGNCRIGSEQLLSHCSFWAYDDTEKKDEEKLEDSQKFESQNVLLSHHFSKDA